MGWLRCLLRPKEWAGLAHPVRWASPRFRNSRKRRGGILRVGVTSGTTCTLLWDSSHKHSPDWIGRNARTCVRRAESGDKLRPLAPWQPSLLSLPIAFQQQLLNSAALQRGHCRTKRKPKDGSFADRVFCVYERSS